MLNFPKFSLIFLNFIKYYFWKILEKFINFCSNFCFKFFQKSLMSTFFLNSPSEPKFWRRHCSTGLERIYKFILYISVQNVVWCSPRTKILAPLVCIIAFVWKRKGVYCTFLGVLQCTTLLALTFRLLYLVFFLL